MLDTIRHKLFSAITTTRGDSLAPVRVQKDLARRLNAVLGSPLCTKEELARRTEARARLVKLRASGEALATVRESAPVMVYFEKDRNARELVRIEETLKARNMPYKLLDVTGDEATMAFVTRASGCKEDELPVVFVADKAIGAFRALIEADVSGALAKAVYGDAAS